MSYGPMWAIRDEWPAILARGIEGCRTCSHVPEAPLKRLEKVKPRDILGVWTDSNWSTTEHSMTVFMRAGKEYAVLHEGEDYTGHGCQCSGDVQFYPSKREAIALGLDDNERKTL